MGEKPLVNIFLNNWEVEGLWDTGSMISLMNKNYVEEHFPGVEIHSVADFIQNDSLKLTAANQTELSVDGVVVLNFGVEKDHNLFQVPFIVRSENISKPTFTTNFLNILNP